MLLEFRIRNFRSFLDESTLSLVASRDKYLSDRNTTKTNVPSVPRALRSAVVYGANASGKSNLLRALQLMRGMVVDSATLQPGQAFNVQPFKLDKESSTEPTMFEITAVLDGVRFQYGFEFMPSRITAEWLLVYQRAKPQQWFSRELGNNADKFEFGTHFVGQKRTWQEATRPNALFLSTAIQLNSEQLKPLFQWFANSLIVLMDGGVLPFTFSAERIQSAGQDPIRSLLGAADIGISSISVLPQKGVRLQSTFDLETGKSEARTEERSLLVPMFTHVNGNVTADFDFGDESQGTQKLFALAGPLFDILEHGRVLVIDELDRSLHPLLVRQVVNAFQDPEQNPRGAQLVFSTHDTSLLQGKLLRRDQIWLSEKGQNQSSRLVPLTEFSPRKGEAFEKGYLTGRYGGIPILAERLIDRVRFGSR
jgi:uncharacterized protein